MQKVLYINHRSQKCGVYEFGLAIGQALVASSAFDIRYEECDSMAEFKKAYSAHTPGAVIYNYHPRTMPWIARPLFRNLVYPTTRFHRTIHIGMIHEVFQELADTADNRLFDFHVCADPTLLLKNPLVFKTGRLVPAAGSRTLLHHDVPVIGSFGFAVGAKQFTRIVDQAQDELDEAVIRINISYARFGDEDGSEARRLGKELLQRIRKKGIRLEITHDHFTHDQLIDFLAGNDLNVFFYEPQRHRGIASSTDWALSVDRPIAINKSMMFRHLFDVFPSVCIEDRSFRQILESGTGRLARKHLEWSEENMRWDYERMLAAVFRRGRARFAGKLKTAVLNRLGKGSAALVPWVKKDDNMVFTGFSDLRYTPLPGALPMNRLLDNEARTLYAPAIDFLFRVAPDLMKKKIPEANVQQAFVFDTACRMAAAIGPSCRILAVGAFEDTAVQALKKTGYDVDEIDPVMNYDLHTFLGRPSVKPGSYDLVISTSVIEHVDDDEQFVRDIATLLRPGGSAVITCDFHDGYKPGALLPPMDVRLYTKFDLTTRLPSVLPGCQLAGTPQYDAAEYDFLFLGKYRYTFATFVFTRGQ